jgi:hypothetical protein
MWFIRLHTDIANFTMEVEYSTLSTVMRDVRPIKMLVTEISTNVGLTQEPITHFWTMVWEDNAGALKIAALEPRRMNPRSQWYRIK